MKAIRFALIGALLSAMMSVGMASGQAYTTSFITSITYQNLGTANATIVFQFYNQGSGTPVTVNKSLPAGAGSSLFLGGNDVGLSSGFLGSVVVSSNQTIAATAVQIPQPSTSPVKNRPLSNGFSTATGKVLLATLLKNTFNTTSKFSIQNASQGAIDIKVKIYDAANPTAAPIEVTSNNVPVGAAKYFDMGNISQISAASFNGSAIVEAFQTGTTTPANIVGSVLELSTNGNAAKAFEGVSAGAAKVFMASAICNAFGGQNSAYAVLNTAASGTANVTVKYSNGNSETKSINAGAKASFLGCGGGNPAGFSGSASIESTGGDIVAIGKVTGGGAFETAFLGEAVGSAKLALPYVRWTADATFNNGARQRTFLAIQNVGAAALTNVTVKYLDKNGNTLGTHTIASIAAGAKANSRPIDATGDAAKLLEFGTPDSQPDKSGFGGAAIIEATGGQLIAVARVATVDTGTGKQVSEDFNGIAVQ